MSRSSIYNAVRRLHDIIAKPEFRNEWMTMPRWPLRSARAMSHFVGTVNVAMAVDGFSVRCRVAAGLSDEERRKYCARGGRDFKLVVGIGVDGLRMVRLFFGGEPGARHDSALFRSTTAYAAIHSGEHGTLGSKLLVIGDLAFRRTSRVVTKIHVPLPQLWATLWE